MKSAPDSSSFVIPIMPVDFSFTSSTWWNCLLSINCIWRIQERQLRCAMLNSQSLIDGKGPIAWPQQQEVTDRWWGSVWDLRRHRYHYYVDACRSGFCKAYGRIWEISGIRQLAHRTSLWITLFTVTFHQRCWDDVAFKVVDIAAVVLMVRPTCAAIFSDYIPMHIAPDLKSLLGPTIQWLGAVWDNYTERCLKRQAHLRRGNGLLTQLGPESRTSNPKGDWQKYLSNSDNKKELFA